MHEQTNTPFSFGDKFSGIENPFLFFFRGPPKEDMELCIHVHIFTFSFLMG